jgi:hypothetical protein
MSIVVAYPYDPDGSREECRIKDERHVITTNNNTYRVIAPELAPFFRKDLEVVHTASAHVLKEGVDYYLGNKLTSVKAIASSPLFGTIVLINPNLFGEFTLNYRTVGSTFVGVRSEIMTYLANHLTDPVKTPFERIIDRPEYYTPHEHEMHYADFLNKEGVADALEDLNQAILDASANEAAVAVADLEQRVVALNALLNQYRYDLHIVDKTNPHATTAVQAMALPAHQAAQDTFLAFNKTLMELAEYINVRGITQADMDLYLHKVTSQTLSDTLTLQDGQAVLRNQLGNVTLNLASGDVVLNAPGMIELAAAVGVLTSAIPNRLKAGKNVLEIISDGSVRAETSLKYNGKMVYTTKNIRAELLGIGAGPSRIVTANTQYVEMSGAGWEAAPLVANLRLPAATLTGRGITRLSSSLTGTRQNVAATPKAINDLRLKVNNYVPSSRRVNGKELTADVTVTTADLNLDRVDNTNDLEKPISTPQQQLLAGYAAPGHKHPVGEIEVPIADETTAGIMSMVNDLEVITSMRGGATPQVASEIDAVIKELEYDTGALQHSSTLNLKWWTLDDAVGFEEPIITYSGFVITIPAGAKVYLNQVDFTIDRSRTVNGATLDLATLFPTNHKYRTFYIYMQMVNGNIDYVALTSRKVVESNSECFLFAVQTDGTTLTAGSGYGFAVPSDGILHVQPVTSVGMFSELEAHLDETLPHGGGANDGLTQLGLDLLKNVPTSDGVSIYSHDNLDRWDIVTTYSDVAFSKRLISVGGSTAAMGTIMSSQVTQNGHTILYSRMPQWDDNIRQRTVSYVIEPGGTANQTAVGICVGEGVINNTPAVVVVGIHNSGDVTFEVIVKDGGFQLIPITVLLTGDSQMPANIPYHVKTTINKDGDTPFVITVTMAHGNTYREVTCTVRKGINLEFHVERTAYAAGSIPVYTTNAVTVESVGASAGLRDVVGPDVFGLTVGPRVGAGSGPWQSEVTINCVGDSALGQSQEYLTAEAAYNAIKTNANVMILTGQTTGTLPVPPPCSRYVVLYGFGDIGTAGAASNGTGPGIDGFDIRLSRPAESDADITSRLVQGADTLKTHTLTIKTKYESEGAAAAATHPGTLNYMIIAYRDI